MSTLACLALVVGLYYANRANNLKSKALKQEQKTRRNVVPEENPIKEAKKSSERAEDISNDQKTRRNNTQFPTQNPIKERTISVEATAKVISSSEEQQNKRNNIEETEKSSKQVKTQNNSSKKKNDDRIDEGKSKFSDEKNTPAPKSAKTKDRGKAKRKVEVKSTTVNNTKQLSPKLVDFKRVPRLDGVKVGYERNMELEPGKMYKVITRSLRPPIFEIPNFLTGEECQQIIKQVKKQVLEPSPVSDINNDNIEPTNQETFNEWDYNKDHVISPIEVMHNMIDLSDLYFSQKDITKMFKDLKVDKNGNGVIDLGEFLHVTTYRIVRYLHDLARNLNRVKGRNSKQTWAEHSVIKGLDERVAALTKLPVVVVAQSEKLQVVQYDPEGHYHCHHDSQPIEEEVPCCYERDKRHCRLCR
ncbi:transmembrane prolyl 4-hydroxylase [Exaiptasia diaphana]|uniref:EF-hand domain-containing protein n=1 Tax=Exaiptasia diaphana TaxID=2652724 RepID=A0A913WNY4_EXADI|nr:transmembrane prolyl 4-hydroxylase [Exaiptasia diaphana]